MKPLFSIITPNFNSLDFLRQCKRSVADQQVPRGTIEHWIIDGGSNDGTPAWLAENHPAGYWLSEPDNGMYDAINKGLHRAQGDLVAYLNADEQYLPGTLCHVADYFEDHPECDILFGDALLIRPDGSYMASRRGYPPRWSFLGSSHLYVLSCTMFLRRRVFAEYGLQFDPSWRTVGDLDFVLRALRAGFKLKYSPRYTSAFVITGDNLGGGTMALAELMRIRQTMPCWVRLCKVPLNIARVGVKILYGGYQSDRGRAYDVYSGQNATTRTTFTIERTKYGWPKP